MSTRTLLDKYSTTLGELHRDAVKNQEEAENGLQQCIKVLQEKQRELKKLKDVMQKNRRGFMGAARAIVGMIYKCPESPEEISRVLEPIMNYQSALEAVPEAEDVYENAKALKDAAESELTMASFLVARLEGVMKT